MYSERSSPVLGLQVQELRDDDIRDLVVDRDSREDDPLVEQPRVDVVFAFAARVRSITVGISGMALTLAVAGIPPASGAIIRTWRR